MKIKTKYKPELMVGDDETRRPLLQCYLTEAGNIEATDGKKLIRLPVELEPGDVPGFVPAKALKDARKIARKAETVSISLNGSVELPDGSTLPREDLGRWPQTDQVFRLASPCGRSPSTRNSS